MADGYWNQQRHHQPPMSSISHGGPLKRPRSDFGHDMHSFVSRDEDRGNPHSVKDTRTIGSAYDLYLQSVQTSSMPSEEAGRFNGVGMGRRGGDNVMPRPSMGELMAGRGGMLPPDFGPNGRGLGFDQQDLVGRPSRELLRLPPDASNTLFVEGLPSNCSRREQLLVQLCKAIEWMKMNLIPRFCKSNFQETQVQDQDNAEEGGDESVSLGILSLKAIEIYG
ncbi:hypothetical protein Bca4012_055926 [Brassica carinata]